MCRHAIVFYCIKIKTVNVSFRRHNDSEVSWIFLIHTCTLMATGIYNHIMQVIRYIVKITATLLYVALCYSCYRKQPAKHLHYT